METLHIFQNAYNRTVWQNTLTDIFSKHVSRINLLQRPQIIEGIDTKIANNAYQLGTLLLADATEIALYEVQLCDNIHIQRNRVGIRNLLHREWRYYDGALIVSYQQTTPEWRFSFISETKGWDADDNWTTLKTQPTRYTYLFGDPNGQYKTPCKRFEALAQTPQIDLAKLKEAFSVEALSKEFYAKLYDWYLWATSDEVGVTFPNDPTTDTDDRDNKNIKTIRLITRVLFCWFIRQKGFIPADLFKQEFAADILRDFPFGIGTGKARYQEEAFNPTSTTSANYYAAILQNLFFATLNNEVHDRQWANEDAGRNDEHYGIKQLWRDNKGFSFFKGNGKATLEALLRNIPYMNGGLFECLDKMGEDEKHKTIYYDGFSRDNLRQKRAFLPNALFFNPESEGARQGLFTLLEQYNFTIEENSANDAQVSLDPELLGRVFENLLAAYNPETQESARKSTGSFYTPRIIVDYMVGESIKQYLRTQCAFLTEEQLGVIINDTKRPDNVTDSQCENIIAALKSIKILDPACGSGAFPMGILLRMVEIIETLCPNQNNYDRYQLKLDIINNCIYGVDIQSIAMLISKLRFFITLICEQDELDPTKENYGIHTLPNLETKLVAANTLVGLKKKAVQGNLFEDPQIAVLQEQLRTIRHDHFAARTFDTKKELRRKDEKTRKQLAVLLENNGDFAPEDAIQLAAWNPYNQNTTSPFFDADWMFDQADGFDIVIGNPPYVSTKGREEKDKAAYEKEFGFNDDLYNLFTFKGLRLCKEGGILTYITSKTYWTIQTKQNMRDLLLSKRIDYIFDTANPFEAAMVDTCVIQVTNVPYQAEHNIRFLDGTENLATPKVFAPIPQSHYLNTVHTVIFKPTELNLKIYNKYASKVKALYEQWWDKIKTSRDIEKNREELEAYRQSLKPGDIALLGCLTEGGQGLATANNGKYIAVRSSTKWAANIRESRPKKLAEAIKKYHIAIPELSVFSDAKAFLQSKTETEIAELFDSLKEQYGRDIFGQGYIYKIIDDSQVANVDELTQDEKENGIETTKNYYVPYDKGDKDGNRWYLETPFAIAWSQDNVRFLKTDPKARYQGYAFFFKEGFTWTDINSTYLKARLKANGVFDVVSMSLFSETSLPDWYFVCLINTSLLSLYVDNFVNCTSHFQINDARQLPVIIPTNEELEILHKLFAKATIIKQTNNDIHELQQIDENNNSVVSSIYGI